MVSYVVHCQRLPIFGVLFLSPNWFVSKGFSFYSIQLKTNKKKLKKTMQLCFIVCWIILKPILIHKLWKIDGIFQPEVPYSWCVISVNILSFAPDCRYICLLVSLHSPPMDWFWPQTTVYHFKQWSNETWPWEWPFCCD